MKKGRQAPGGRAGSAVPAADGAYDPEKPVIMGGRAPPKAVRRKGAAFGETAPPETARQEDASSGEADPLGGSGSLGRSGSLGESGSAAGLVRTIRPSSRATRTRELP